MIMITAEKTSITVQTVINAPIERVWSLLTDPKHIVHWNHASSDWHSPFAENDLRVGGKFKIRMEARDGSGGFDFGGEYDGVILLKQIKYTMDDGRTVQLSFSVDDENTIVTETFESEATNPLDFQQKGWQAILDNFKKYVERTRKSEVLHFEIQINAAPEKVYKIMIDDEYYQEWTSAFNPKSYFEGTWQKGSKIRFIGETQDGSQEGMISRIKENIPNRFISIEHLGLVIKGKDVLCGPEVDTWAGALENYTFTPQDGKTLLSIDADANENYSTYFTDTWPQALQKLKSICEK
jgi:uncharacterized protein YndB with AHSA1/START domain